MIFLYKPFLSLNSIQNQMQLEQFLKKYFTLNNENKKNYNFAVAVNINLMHSSL